MNTPVKEHPTVRAHHQRPALPKTSEPLDAAWLRQLCLDAGADDVGFVEVDRPAGEDVIGPYLASKKDFADDVLRPLQAKREPVYVVRGSDAETHVQKRYPHKTVRQVRSSLRPRSIANLLFGMPLSFHVLLNLRSSLTESACSTPTFQE
jgi:hypothetical protein